MPQTYSCFYYTLFRYYRCDRDVRRDRELQSFTNEVSADGTGEDGGNGKVSLTVLLYILFVFMVLKIPYVLVHWIPCNVLFSTSTDGIHHKVLVV